MMYYTTNPSSSFIYDMLSDALDKEIAKSIREKAEVKKTIFDEIKDVRFNAPATIIFWKDGTKTVVKAQDEWFDKEKGFAMAICKKIMGNTGKFNEEFKKWGATFTEEDDDERYFAIKNYIFDEIVSNVMEDDIPSFEDDCSGNCDKCDCARTCGDYPCPYEDDVFFDNNEEDCVWEKCCEDNPCERPVPCCPHYEMKK